MNVPDVWATVIMALATYRISSFIVVDSFPPMAAFRDWFKHHWPDRGDVVNRPPKRGFVQPNAPAGTDPRDVERFRVITGTSLGYLISCMFCMPFWVGVVIWLCWNWFPDQTLFFCVPWVLAGVATLIYTRVDPR